MRLLSLSQHRYFLKLQAYIILLSIVLGGRIAFTLYWQHLSRSTFILSRSNVNLTIDPKSNDHLNHRISVVIINWMRPKNVKLILRSLVKFDEIEKIIIIMANPASTFTYPHPKVRHLVNYSVSDKWGVAVRFHACAYETEHRRVLLLDDDLLLSHDDIYRLMAVTGIHSRPVCSKDFGRIKRYAHRKTDFDRQPHLMCLTRAVLIDRSLCHAFFRYAPLMESFIEQNAFRSTTHWNGEDIFLALVHLYVSNSSSGPFFLDQSHYRDLPHHGAISRRPRHYEYRYAFLGEAARQLNLSRHLPLVYGERHRQLMRTKRQKNTIL
jgi:hypothetical protein